MLYGPLSTAVLAPAGLHNPTEPSEDELAASIRAKLAAGTAHYIAAGLECIEAKKRLQGRFTAFVETKLGWDIDTVERWMRIAEVFADSDPGRIPTGWTALYALARLPAKTRDDWIADGTIHPRLTRKQAEVLIRRAEGSNLNGGGGSELQDHQSHADDDGAGDRAGGDDKDRDDAGKGTTTTGAAFDEIFGAISGAPQPATQDNVSDDIGADSESEIERKLARAEELERQAGLWQTQRTGLEREVKELEARLDETSIPHQRRLFRRALQTLQKAETSGIHEKEQRALRADATTDFVEFVRSAKRDGLAIDRFDVFCRPEVH